jgi:hypothetical protein
MAKITIFKPGKAEEYNSGVTNVTATGSSITFYWQPDSSTQGSKKITTSLPFLLEEDLG